MKKEDNQDSIPQWTIKPYSLRELAKLYNISDKCLKTWLLPFTTEIGDKKGWYFNLKQVRIIFEKLGVPLGVIDK